MSSITFFILFVCVIFISYWAVAEFGSIAEGCIFIAFSLHTRTNGGFKNCYRLFSTSEISLAFNSIFISWVVCNEITLKDKVLAIVKNFINNLIKLVYQNYELLINIFVFFLIILIVFGFIDKVVIIT